MHKMNFHFLQGMCKGAATQAEILNKTPYSFKKVNRKVQEEPQAEAQPTPDTRRRRESDTD